MPQGKLEFEDHFYNSVSEALNEGRPISKTFVNDLVDVCDPLARSEKMRTVFILDEYEVLFHRLRTACDQNEALRYTVAQPLLSQMTIFTRENLLVLLGQEPDAHHILMEQNQLSPYVQQDAFPLFRFTPGTRKSEFTALIEKVFANRAEFDDGFAQAVYGESGGHPFLTVNVLVDFVDWLIERERPMNALFFEGHDFESFAENRLTAKKLKFSPRYEFFRSAVAEATSVRGQKSAPWLYSVYLGLAYLMREKSGSGTLRSVRSNFLEYLSELDPMTSGLQPDEVLRRGAQANFFEYNDHYVWPKVPILGRIAASTRPALTP